MRFDQYLDMALQVWVSINQAKANEPTKTKQCQHKKTSIATKIGIKEMPHCWSNYSGPQILETSHKAPCHLYFGNCSNNIGQPSLSAKCLRIHLRLYWIPRVSKSLALSPTASVLIEAPSRPEARDKLPLQRLQFPALIFLVCGYRCVHRIFSFDFLVALKLEIMKICTKFRASPISSWWFTYSCIVVLQLGTKWTEQYHSPGWSNFKLLKDLLQVL